MNINIEERSNAAREYFLQGYNCCQSVVMAFSDIVGISPETLASAATGFGGGMGRMREVCGTVSAMTMLSGFLSPAPDPSEHAARTANYALVQKFAAAFREETGSIVCRELLGVASPAEAHSTSPAPSTRTGEYYKKRPCAELVALAASIVARHLAEKEQISGIPKA